MVAKDLPRSPDLTLTNSPDHSDSPSPSDSYPSTPSILSLDPSPLDNLEITDLLASLSIMSDNFDTLATLATPTATTTIVELDTTTKPGKYDGARDGFQCLTFLKEVNRYFTMKNITGNKRTIHAIGFLGRSSLLWWESLGHEDTCAYETFVSAFKKAYMPAGFFDQVRHLLLTAKFETTLAEYLTRLRLYMNLLLADNPSRREMLEENVITVFLQGCPLDLQIMLRSDRVSNPNITFEQMCAKAEEWDYIHSFGPQGATAHQLTSTLALSHSRGPVPPPKPAPTPAYDPMAMEIDNINLANVDPTTRLLFTTMNSFGVALNAMSQQLNKFGSNNYNNRQQQKNLGKLTPEERNFLRANDGCYRCRKPHAGHVAANCPNNRTQAINSITNVNTFSAGQPGNAPSN